MQDNQTINVYDETVQNMFSNKEYNEDYIFYACMLSKCDVFFTEGFNAPAGVSFSGNYNLYINLKLFSNYNLTERIAILKHEMLHILNGHLLYRNENKKNRKWNLATDCAINQLINPEHLPKDCITVKYISSLVKKNVKKLEASEYYYDLLMQIPDNRFENIENHDNHKSWDVNDSDIPEEIQNQITSEIISDAMEDSSKMIGSYPNRCSVWLQIHSTKTKVNWKKLLKSYIRTNGYKKTIFKRNRRNPNRMDLKGKIKEKENKLLYIIDASGSVSNKDFKLLNKEIISLCSELKAEINAIQVDTEASEPEKLTKNTKLIERKRNAGTMLSEGIQKAEECKLQYDTIIISTDGYLSASDVEEFIKTKKKLVFLISSKGSDGVFKKYKNKLKYIKLPK